jgi:epoxyqueuosine reductase QueG
MKIIHANEVLADPGLAQAHDILKTARRIIFLGFGYDPVNLGRPQLKERLPEHCQIFAAAHGMTAKEKEELNNLLLGNLTSNHQDPQIGSSNRSNLDFLRETGCLKTR